MGDVRVPALPSSTPPVPGMTTGTRGTRRVDRGSDSRRHHRGRSQVDGGVKALTKSRSTICCLCRGFGGDAEVREEGLHADSDLVIVAVDGGPARARPLPRWSGTVSRSAGSTLRYGNGVPSVLVNPALEIYTWPWAPWGSNPQPADYRRAEFDLSALD